MNRERFKEYKEENPYHVWIHHAKGKIVGHFKNRADVMRWKKASGFKGTIGTETTAAKTKHKRRRSHGFGGMGDFGGMGGGSWGW